MRLNQALAVDNASGNEIYSAEIPDGNAGVRATLKLMARLVREYKTSDVIRQTALQLVGNLAPKDFSGEIDACFYFVRDNIRYVLDTNEVEVLHTPDTLLKIGQGDCDDKSTLLAALLESIGHPARFKAVGFEGGELSHVYVEARMGNGWIPLDATEPVDPGWEPPGIVNAYIYHI